MILQPALTARIVAFLRDIGLDVRAEAISEQTILPGITIRGGALIFDEARLQYPGDLLHEAGHLAVVPAARRRDMQWNVGTKAAEEMSAIAWSYAAAVHLGLPAAVVFHPDGYRGGGEALADNFSRGHYVGVPTLQWIGLTYERKQAEQLGVAPYPHMIQWLRD